MAGEIEEPMWLDFQAVSFHSGSISFGRFETETLCWERRSSISHNRYLEDVEKCSKPGLVDEKKAYFKAHFRKKGILRLSSPESLNEYQTTENDVVEKTGHGDEINHSDTVNGTSSTCDITDSTDRLSDHAKLGSVLEIEVKRNLDGDESNINYTRHVSNVGPFSDDRATERNDDASAIRESSPRHADIKWVL